MIYLVHFDPPLGRASHYLGSTPDDRLDTRLREHALGRGSTLLAAAVRTGSKLYLARTFPGLGPEAERIMKRHKHFKNMCPLCCPMFASLKTQVFQIDTTRPDQPPARAVLDWRQADPAGTSKP